VANYPRKKVTAEVRDDWTHPENTYDGLRPVADKGNLTTEEANEEFAAEQTKIRKDTDHLGKVELCRNCGWRAWDENYTQYQSRLRLSMKSLFFVPFKYTFIKNQLTIVCLYA
jgi:hypothetical protein